MLDELADAVQDTIQELRDLAHGIYPPLLMDSGLPEALRAAANRSPLAVWPSTPTALGRYPSEVEAAVYFCCLEALQNAGKHAPGATVHIDGARGRRRPALRGGRRRARLRRRRRRGRARLREHERPPGRHRRRRSTGGRRRARARRSPAPSPCRSERSVPEPAEPATNGPHHCGHPIAGSQGCSPPRTNQRRAGHTAVAKPSRVRRVWAGVGSQGGGPPCLQEAETPSHP